MYAPVHQDPHKNHILFPVQSHFPREISLAGYLFLKSPIPLPPLPPQKSNGRPLMPGD